MRDDYEGSDVVARGSDAINCASEPPLYKPKLAAKSSHTGPTAQRLTKQDPHAWKI